MRNYTDLNLLIDRSGSMRRIKDAMEESLASYINKLKETGKEIVVSAAQFDDQYQTLYTAVPVKDAPPITIVPDGSTALLGGIGRLVDEIGKRLSDMPEDQRPNEVIVVIISDGQENYSQYAEWAKQYTQQAVFDKIGHQRNVYNWQFIFMGSDQDAIATANMYNIPATNAVRYSNTAKSVHNLSERLFSGTNKLLSRSVEEKCAGAVVAAFEANEQDITDEADAANPPVSAANAATKAAPLPPTGTAFERKRFLQGNTPRGTTPSKARLTGVRK